MGDPKPRALVPRAITPQVATPRAITPRTVSPRFTRNRGPRRFGQRGPRRPERPTLSRLVAGLILCVLMGLPGLAAIKLSQEIPMVRTAGFFLLGSSVAYVVCALDKLLAINRKFRIPENLLHFLEIFGGWPGSFLAQHRYRHKVSKVSYQIIFWLIVAGYQFAAMAYIFDIESSSEMVRNYLHDLAQKFS